MSKHYLLFHDLGYDYNQEFPIELGNSVMLDKPPYSLLSDKPAIFSDREYYALVNIVLPGKTLPGSGINHCCLSIDSDVLELKEHKPDELFFIAIISLRLWKPVYINIAGGFEYLSEDEPVHKPYYHGKSSTCVFDDLSVYDYDDICNATEINSLLLKPLCNNERIKNSIVFFSHVTNGLIYLFQFGYIGLFAALEALFPVDGSNKGEQLADIVSLFLSNKYDREIIYEFIKKEYKEQRNNIAHGKYSFSFASNDSEMRNINFKFLHEITRLCILGFLSMDDITLKHILKTKSSKLKSVIAEVGPAKGRFVDEQVLMRMDL